jgi:hypothetical protein
VEDGTGKKVNSPAATPGPELLTTLQTLERSRDQVIDSNRKMDLHLPGRVCVLVEKDPNAPRYSLKAWVQRQKVKQAENKKDQYYWEQLPPSGHAEPQYLAWSQFPEWFDNLLVWIADYRRKERDFKPKEFQIEVFLPGELLNQEIEQIAPPDEEDGFPIALGREYRVVVRLANRSSKRQANWEGKWQKLEEVRTNCALQHLLPANCTGDELKELVEQLTEADVIGVRRSCPPEAQWQGSFLASISRAGLPVAVWVRRDIPDLDCAAELDRLLAGSLWELPQRVHEARRSKKPIAQHVSLLWDDPDCLPPDYGQSLKWPSSPA